MVKAQAAELGDGTVPTLDPVSTSVVHLHGRDYQS